MELKTQMEEDLIIKETRNGKGIFAGRDFESGELLFKIKGTICDQDQLDSRGEKLSNAFRYDEETFVSPDGNIGDFLNHSCVPNAAVIKTDKELILFAVKNISKDEEVVMDYSTLIADDDIWTMECNCGVPECRKTIEPFSTLPQETKERYVKEKIVPNHILALNIAYGLETNDRT